MIVVMTKLEQEIQILGGAVRLAEAIGVGQSAISNLVSRGGTPTPANCLAIERATDGAITRKDLRPDDFWLIWPDLAEPKRQKAKKQAV